MSRSAEDNIRARSSVFELCSKSPYNILNSEISLRSKPSRRTPDVFQSITAQE
jgi:hypothetical protein